MQIESWWCERERSSQSIRYYVTHTHRHTRHRQEHKHEPWEWFVHYTPGEMQIAFVDGTEKERESGRPGGCDGGKGQDGWIFISENWMCRTVCFIALYPAELLFLVYTEATSGASSTRGDRKNIVHDTRDVFNTTMATWQFPSVFNCSSTIAADELFGVYLARFPCWISTNTQTCRCSKSNSRYSQFKREQWR